MYAWELKQIAIMNYMGKNGVAVEIVFRLLVIMSMMAYHKMCMYIKMDHIRANKKYMVL